MKKGMMQLQTIIYVIFAIIILIAGIFSVQSYLTKLEITTNCELSNMDLAVMAKRTVGSDKCFINEERIVSNTADSREYTVLNFDQGNLIKSKILSNSDTCFDGFDPDKYRAKFYTISPKTEIHSWGNLVCDSPNMNLLVQIDGELGLVELCAYRSEIKEACSNG